MGRKILSIMFLGAPFVVLILIVLVLLKPSVPPVPTDAGAANAFDQKFRDLKDALQRGLPKEIHITETEINSKLQKTIGSSQGSKDGRAKMKAAVLHFDGDGFSGLFTLDVHRVSLYVSLGGKVGVQNHSIQFTPTEVKLGRLPMPVFLVKSTVHEKLNSPELRDRMKLPEQVKDIHIENHELVVQVE
jgi:hypothetical protein